MPTHRRAKRLHLWPDGVGRLTGTWSAVVSKLYANQPDRMAILVKRANPGLTASEAAARAAIITGSTDGFMNTIGVGKTRPTALSDVRDDQLIDQLMRFATMPATDS